MTTNDWNLINKAGAMKSHQWQDADLLVDLADTDEAKDRLQGIARRLYHRDEYFANCL